jgi:hypothetical protein
VVVDDDSDRVSSSQGGEAATMTAPSNADYEALRELIELCRDGRFYEDYDQSTDVLGRADEALNRLFHNDGTRA